MSWGAPGSTFSSLDGKPVSSVASSDLSDGGRNLAEQAATNKDIRQLDVFAAPKPDSAHEAVEAFRQDLERVRMGIHLYIFCVHYTNM